MRKYMLMSCCLLLLAVAGQKSVRVESDQVQYETQREQVVISGDMKEAEVLLDEEDEEALVQMRKVTPAPEAKTEEKKTDEEKILGTETETSTEITIVNKTGKKIAAFYIRPFNMMYDDTYWDEELMQDEFILNANEKASYYFDGEEGMTYDIRLVYENGEEENFFRKLPLKEALQVNFVVNQSGIPYVTYLEKETGKEVSTLNDVLTRMGLEFDESYLLLPDEEETPEEDEENSGETGTSVSGREIAQGYIGQSIDALLGDSGVGSVNDVVYGTDPDMGDGGYYIFNEFTVNTSVDEYGNEIVTQVW